MTPKEAERTYAMWPWCNLAATCLPDDPGAAERMMRVGLVVRYIAEANIPEDVRDRLYVIATEKGLPQWARVACAGWVRSVISAEVDPTMPGLDAA